MRVGVVLLLSHTKAKTPVSMCCTFMLHGLYSCAKTHVWICLSGWPRLSHSATSQPWKHHPCMASGEYHVNADRFMQQSDQRESTSNSCILSFWAAEQGRSSCRLPFCQFWPAFASTTAQMRHEQGCKKILQDSTATEALCAVLCCAVPWCPMLSCRMQRRVDAGAACISLKKHPYFYTVGMQCAEL